MGRGPETAETKLRKAAEAMALVTGKSIDDVYLELKAKLPKETKDDQIAEAQAVIWYYETNGQHFNHKTCKGCGELFAYCWDRSPIAYCSVACARVGLKQIGLDWDPTRDQSRRWGRTAPAIVSSFALRQLLETLALNNDQKDQVLDKYTSENPEQSVLDYTAQSA